MKTKKPLIGLSVIIMKPNEKKVLLGKRKGSHGAGTWSFPGGHLEIEDNSFQKCIQREVKEELGKQFKISLLDDYPPVSTYDYFKKEGLHYVTSYLRAKYLSGKPEVMEPDKYEEWKWYEWENLSEKRLFLPVRNLIKLCYNPFEDIRFLL